MEDLFRSYWWLLLIAGYMLIGGYSSLLNYLRQKETLKLIRTYVERGQEPPESLLKVLNRPIDSETEFWGGGENKPANYWSLFGLFAALAAGFTGAHYFTEIARGTDAFLIVAMTMGAVAVWALVSALTSNKRR